MIETVQASANHAPAGSRLLRHVGIALFAALMAVLYYPTAAKLTAYWDANEVYSYGYLVPIISGYLIWLRRRRLQSLQLAPSLMGGLVLAGGLAMLVIGRASNTNLLEWLSLPISIAGACLLVFGSARTIAIAFPLLYLFAMIPVWDFLLVRLQQPFQLYSAILGVGVLRLLGLPVMREGVFIYLPNATLEVADVCSGVNQLVAILCIGIPAAHLQMRRWSKRLLIVIAAATIALLSNGVRVAVLSGLAYNSIIGPDSDVHGPYSVLRTMAVSGVGFVVLLWLIARYSDGPDREAHDNERSASVSRARRAVNPMAVALGAGLILTTVAFEQWHDVRRVSPRTPLSAFPSSLAGWNVLDELPAPNTLTPVGFDHTLSRRYVSPEGKQFELLIGYFEVQRQGRELVGYEASRLLSSANASTPNVPAQAPVRDYLTTVDGRAYFVTYWYVLNGRIVASEYAAKGWTTWYSLTRRLNAGALVLVRARVDDGETLDATRSRVRGPIDAIVAASRRHFSGGQS